MLNYRSDFPIFEKKTNANFHGVSLCAQQKDGEGIGFVVDGANFGAAIYYKSRFNFHVVLRQNIEVLCWASHFF